MFYSCLIDGNSASIVTKVSDVWVRNLSVGGVHWASFDLQTVPRQCMSCSIKRCPTNETCKYSIKNNLHVCWRLYIIIHILWLSPHLVIVLPCRSCDEVKVTTLLWLADCNCYRNCLPSFSVVLPPTLSVAPPSSWRQNACLYMCVGSYLAYQLPIALLTSLSCVHKLC